MDKVYHHIPPGKGECPVCHGTGKNGLDIQKEWKNIYFGAKPYLDALLSLANIHSRYGYDSCTEIITYFLANASGFRGDKAKALKSELKAHLNSN